jgi:hypothetical protein
MLDAAAVALALVVTGSLALLAWTLGVSAVHRVHRGRRAVAQARAELALAERRMQGAGARSREHLRNLADRTRLDRRKGA